MDTIDNHTILTTLFASAIFCWTYSLRGKIGMMEEKMFMLFSSLECDDSNTECDDDSNSDFNNETNSESDNETNNTEDSVKDSKSTLLDQVITFTNESVKLKAMARQLNEEDYKKYNIDKMLTMVDSLFDEYDDNPFQMLIKNY
jgi:hypothetical protein